MGTDEPGTVTARIPGAAQTRATLVLDGTVVRGLASSHSSAGRYTDQMGAKCSKVGFRRLVDSSLESGKQRGKHDQASDIKSLFMSDLQGFCS